MSFLLFKRFLARPFQVAYVVPSFKALTRKVVSKCDLSKPRVIVELGPGEGCHTREIVTRMHPDSRLLLFEIDQVLAEHLRKQFAHDPRVEVITTDAARISEELAARGLEHCDYVISGIPFSLFDIPTKQRLLRAVYEALAPLPHASFVVYQCTHELRRHATMFVRVESEFFLRNLPPMFVTVYHKQELNGRTHVGACCDGPTSRQPHGINGHG
jgi:phospholipid N-methyltransferase